METKDNPKPETEVKGEIEERMKSLESKMLDFDTEKKSADTESKSLMERLDKLEKELKAAMETPQHKSIQENMKVELSEAVIKSRGPLDIIR